MWNTYSPAHFSRICVDIEFLIVENRVVPFEIGACSIDAHITFKCVIWPDVRVLPPTPTQPQLSWKWLAEHNAVPLRVAMSNFVHFLQMVSNGKPILLCAHNAAVSDGPLLSRMCMETNLCIPHCFVFDTLPFLRYAFRGATNGVYTQEALALYVAVKHDTYQTHRADDDAAQLAQIVRHAENVRATLLTGLSVPLGSSPVTLAAGIGSGAAQSMAKLNLPLDVTNLILHLQSRGGWPPGLSAEIIGALEKYFVERTKESDCLAQLVRCINLKNNAN